MSNNHDILDAIETQGRASAPQLPPTLRARTLTRCAQVAGQQNLKRRRRGWALIGTLVGVCAIHWLAISSLNAQNNILLGGNNSNQTSARFAMTPDEYRKIQQQRADLLTNPSIDHGGTHMFENEVGE